MALYKYVYDMIWYWRPVYIDASKDYIRRKEIIFMLLESAFR